MRRRPTRAMSILIHWPIFSQLASVKLKETKRVRNGNIRLISRKHPRASRRHLQKRDSCECKRRNNSHSTLSDFARLCCKQSSRMFLAEIDVPPFENGKSWSKCRFFVDPHSTHLPPSLLKTSNF